MIDPNTLTKSITGTILSIQGPAGLFKVLTQTGNVYTGYDAAPRFTVGDTVKVRLQFSITQDKYMVRTMRKAKA